MSEQAVNNQSDCETLRALIPAYSVGATDPEETALVEKLLPLCPEAAVELDDYLALAQAINYTVPLVQPPAALHDKLMAAISTTSTPKAAPVSIAAPAIAPRVAPPAPMRAASRPRTLRLNRVFGGLAAVAAALLIISNVYWVSQVNGLRDQQAQMTTLLHDQQDALTALGTGRGQRTELVSASGDQNTPLATVLWNPQSDLALLYTKALPQLSADKTYQVWLIGDAKPVSVGIFQVDPLGVGVLVIHAEQAVDLYHTVAISTEPAGGSDQPTTTPIAAAQM